MKLLILTQKVDRSDSNLGFFHAWLIKLAAQCEKLTVICLQKGEYNLPANVTVLSLGKENGVSRFTYVIRFYHYIFSLRAEYDGVFVHMNQLYVILGGFFWKMWHKKVLLWYVHRSVTWQLRLAEKLVTAIFTASIESFRLPSGKVQVVGHGIDTAVFIPPTAYPLLPPLRLVTVGRVTKAKDLATLIRSVARVAEQVPAAGCTLTIIGEPVRADDRAYAQGLHELVKSLGAEKIILFYGRVVHQELPQLLASHHLFIQASQTGSVDKAILEPLATGLTVISSGDAFQGGVAQDAGIETYTPRDYQELAQKIEKLYSSGILNTPNKQGREWVKKHHNLEVLTKKIVDFFISKPARRD